MNFHEFGTEHKKILILIHPLGVDWHFFEYVYPVLSKKYHVIIPAIPGMDLEEPTLEFTSIEEIVGEIENYLFSQNIEVIECVYGCSMGGGIMIRMIANGKIRMNTIVIDAGITPYTLPKIICFFIAVGDFLMMIAGKYCSVKMLGYMFDPSKYTKDDLLYVKSVLKNMSIKSIWKAFWSTDNYSMPKQIHQPDKPVFYWYGETEKKARKLDIEFMRNTFDQVVFVENKGQDHAEFASLYPEEFCKRIEALLNE